MDTFSFRLNCVDHYQSVPTAFDPLLPRPTDAKGTEKHENEADVHHLPVIRAFGATESGQKVCAHIHGALPYLYIKYEGSLDQNAVESYIQHLRISIDHALATSYRRNNSGRMPKFVGHISLVKGVPFYGYHVGYTFFLKVYLLNPSHMTRFADLLYQGIIMNTVMQPFESHLQYLLQWMCDYNLYGCASVRCSKVYFRSPVPTHDEIGNGPLSWDDQTIPPEWISDPADLQKESHCTLEVDVCVEDILNRHDIIPRNIHHDFNERFYTVPAGEKLVNSLASLWRDESTRRKKRMGLSDPNDSPFSPNILVSMSADPRSSQRSEWVHEREYRNILAKQLENEKQLNTDAGRELQRFEDHKEGRNVKTALESLEDLFSLNMPRASPRNNFTGLYVEPLKQGNYDYKEPSEQRTSKAPEIGENGLDHAAPGLDLPNEDNIVEKSNQQKKDGPGLSIKDMSSSPNPFPSSSGLVSQQEHHSPSNSSPHIPDKRRRSASCTSDEASANDKKRHKIGHSGCKSCFQSPYGSCDPNSQPSSNTHLGFKPHILSPKAKTPLEPTPRRESDSAWSFNLKPLPRVSEASGTDGTFLHSQHIDRGSADRIVTYPGNYRRQCDLGVRTSFEMCNTGSFLYGQIPPASEIVASTLADYGLDTVVYQDAYYSLEADVPERPREYAGREFALRSKTIPYLPDFNPSVTWRKTGKEHVSLQKDEGRTALVANHHAIKCTLRNWEILKLPPTASSVKAWARRREGSGTGNFQVTPKNKAAQQKASVEGSSAPNSKTFSQINGPTQRNKHGFKFSPKQASTSVRHETQYMSIMSLEIHVNTRGSLLPNPEEDEISCIFWSLESDDRAWNGLRAGIIILSEETGLVAQMRKALPGNIQIDSESDELDLLNRLVDLVRLIDPDILTGYEVHNGSWGYLIERSRLKYDFDMCDELSRMRSNSHGRFGKDADRWGFNHTSTIRVTGRHMINLWRAMRGEMNLLQYSLENVVYHLLHKRIPHYRYQDLTEWYQSGKFRYVALTIDYFLTRVRLDLEILQSTELVPRTSEQARLLGVDFYSVFSRGSQFKVESLMFRIAKPENFILISPSRKQVGQQNALECLPLVMEPQSNFYPSPLLVLDFQSLYPSVMIAYNYCYSTCLGRVVDWRGQNKMGFTDFHRSPGLLDLVRNHINIAPNGIMYVKPEMRRSLLARMLSEILETRVMVKSGMKVDKEDRTLQQLLNNRQLALKLIANVTYGYTSASFSGRMPCSEIADSIVQTGRETLEKAISYIHSVDQWGAEVVYGDTDSLFVYLKGRTREQAFDIGHDIAETITKLNPRPVKLKFEKVYHPCVLLAKKRYVGFKYESPLQKIPEFDAKGIETVRRDGTPAEQKIEERALKILFRSSDLSEVKRYFQKQCLKIMSGRVSIQDFLFAREVKLGTYSDRGLPPPGAMIAARRMLSDPRAEPQYGERVPYAVIAGAPGSRLVDRCVDPEVLLKDSKKQLDAEYYIAKNIIPPLERIFNLVGANIKQWYDEVPKLRRVRTLSTLFMDASVSDGTEDTDTEVVQDAEHEGGLKTVLENYLKSSACVICRAKLPPLGLDVDPTALPLYSILLCYACSRNPARSLWFLQEMIVGAEARVQQIELVCHSCSSIPLDQGISCDNKDCPVFYSRLRANSTFGEKEDVINRLVKSLSSKLQMN